MPPSIEKPTSLQEFADKWEKSSTAPNNRNRTREHIKWALLGYDGGPTTDPIRRIAQQLDPILSPEDRAVRAFMKSVYGTTYTLAPNSVLMDQDLFLATTNCSYINQGLAGLITGLINLGSLRCDLDDVNENGFCPHLPAIVDGSDWDLLEYASRRIAALTSDESLDKLADQVIEASTKSNQILPMIMDLLKERPDATLFYDPDTSLPSIDVMLFPPKTIKIDGYQWTNNKSIHMRLFPFPSQYQADATRSFQYRLHVQAHGTPERSLHRTPALHPHVDRQGTICFGEGASTSNTLACNNRIVEFMDLAVATLNNYSPSNPYWYLPEPENPGNGLHCSVCELLDGSSNINEDDEGERIWVAPIHDRISYPRELRPQHLHPHDRESNGDTPYCDGCWDNRYMQSPTPRVLDNGYQHAQYAVAPWAEESMGVTPEESVWTKLHPYMSHRFLKTSLSNDVSSSLFRNNMRFIRDTACTHTIDAHNQWVELHKEHLSDDAYHEALIVPEEPQAQGQEEEAHAATA